MLEAFLLAWWLPPPPPQCDREPVRLYTIERVAPFTCGDDGSLGCMTFRKDGSCRIMVVPGPYMLDHIRHEKAHCACPTWSD